jgi:hypothetical protein
VSAPPSPEPPAAPPVARAGHSQWFLARDKQKLGPYSSAQLRQLAAAGGLQPEDMIWREGEPKWIAARAIKGLFTAAPVRSPESLFPGALPAPPAPQTPPSPGTDDAESLVFTPPEPRPPDPGDEVAFGDLAAHRPSNHTGRRPAVRHPVPRRRWPWLVGAGVAATVIGATLVLILALSGSSAKDSDNEQVASKRDGAAAVKLNGAPAPKRNEAPAAKSSAAQRPPKNALDLSYIAADFNAAILIHPARLLKSPILADLPTEPMFAELIKEAGVDPRNIEEILLLLDPFPGGNVAAMPAGIVRFKEAVDGQDLLIRHLKGAEPAEFQGKRYYRGTDEIAKAPVAGYAANNRTLLVAAEPTLKKMLGAKNPRSPLLARLPFIDLDHDLILVFLMEQATSSEKKPAVREAAREILKQSAKELPEGLDGFDQLADQVKAVTISLDLTAETLLQIDVEAYDEAAALAIYDLAMNGIATLKQAYDAQKKDLLTKVPPDLAKPLADLTEQLLDGLSPNKDGNHIIVTLKNPEGLPAVAEKLKPLLKDLASNPPAGPARPPKK